MKEYREKENMNWSCTQHVNPTYGGEMWWCCGKVGKDAPGCRKTRHISNNEDSESDTDERDKQEKKYVRCTSCKEVGHTIENCKNDPNMKTGGKPDEEYNRIQKMKDFSCNLCEKKFVARPLLNQHIIKIHENHIH